MRPKKFNFTKILMNGTPASDELATLSIYKNGQMIISRTASLKYGFDAKLIDIVWDSEKRALGFRKISNLTKDQRSKTMRMLKATKNGTIKVPVGRIFKVLGIEKVNYPSLEIEKYQDIMEKDSIYYVELPRVKKTKANESIHQEGETQG